jgi:asparagine synthetase B (glutamine-hydrolysing)
VLRVHGLSAALPPAVQLARRRRNPTRYMPPWLPPAAARDLSVAAGDLDYKRMAAPRWWARLADGFGAGLDAVGIRDTVRRRAAMAGLDARSPFFDVDLVELVLSLPPELSFHPELTRPVQREAMRGLLPDSIRLRPVKSYFDELLQRSFAVEDLDAVQSLLGARDAELGAYVDLHAVRRELLATTPGRNPHGVRFWMAASWRLVTAELWLRREAERSSGAPLQGALVAP